MVNKESPNSNIDSTEVERWWEIPSDNIPPGGILYSEWKEQHPNAIYIRPDGFYKWTGEEYVKVDLTTDDYVQE